jgi:peptidase S24-like protein
VSWWSAAADALLQGNEATVRPRGHSMSPRVRDGQQVALRPLRQDEPRRGDVVLVKVRGRVYLHLVKALESERVLIGNNRGGTNGWTSRSSIFGIAPDL